jgi:hypothetical protein
MDNPTLFERYAALGVATDDVQQLAWEQVSCATIRAHSFG